MQYQCYQYEKEMLPAGSTKVKKRQLLPTIIKEYILKKTVHIKKKILTIKIKILIFATTWEVEKLINNIVNKDVDIKFWTFPFDQFIPLDSFLQALDTELVPGLEKKGIHYWD